MMRHDRRFLYRLCLALGYPTPESLLSVIDSRQISEWMAFYEIEPFGYDRLEYGHAIVAREVRRCMGGGDEPVEAFLPKFGPPDHKSSDSMRRGVLEYVARRRALGGGK